MDTAGPARPESRCPLGSPSHSEWASLGTLPYAAWTHPERAQNIAPEPALDAVKKRVERAYRAAMPEMVTMTAAWTGRVQIRVCS
jgi:hypothetical protein